MIMRAVSWPYRDFSFSFPFFSSLFSFLFSFICLGYLIAWRGALAHSIYICSCSCTCIYIFIFIPIPIHLGSFFVNFSLPFHGTTSIMGPLLISLISPPTGQVLAWLPRICPAFFLLSSFIFLSSLVNTSPPLPFLLPPSPTSQFLFFLSPIVLPCPPSKATVSPSRTTRNVPVFRICACSTTMMCITLSMNGPTSRRSPIPNPRTPIARTPNSYSPCE